MADDDWLSPEDFAPRETSAEEIDDRLDFLRDVSTIVMNAVCDDTHVLKRIIGGLRYLEDRRRKENSTPQYLRALRSRRELCERKLRARTNNE